MYVVGAIEVIAGIVVAIAPWIGGYVVAAWLAGIIVNLLLLHGYYDVALRDFGLLLGALARARVAARRSPSGPAQRGPRSRRETTDRRARGEVR